MPFTDNINDPNSVSQSFVFGGLLFLFPSLMFMLLHPAGLVAAIICILGVGIGGCIYRNPRNEV